MSTVPDSVVTDRSAEPPLYSLKIDSPPYPPDGHDSMEGEPSTVETRTARLPSGISLRRLDQYLSRHFEQTTVLLRQSTISLCTGCLLLGCAAAAVCLLTLPTEAGWMVMAAGVIALLASLAQVLAYRSLVQRSSRAITALERVSAMIAGLESLDRLPAKDRMGPADEMIKRMFAPKPTVTMKKRYHYRR